MNSQRRIGTPPRSAVRVHRRDADGTVPALLARLEAAFPAEPAPADDRWPPVARLATLAGSCIGGWAVVALVFHVAATLI